MLMRLEHLDRQLFLTLNQVFPTPWLEDVLWVVSEVAHAGWLLLIVGAGLWVVDRQRLRSHYGWIVMALVVGGIVVQLLKYGLDRPRPLDAFAPLVDAGTVQLRVVGQRLNHRSFPSGHAQAAASVCTYLLYLYPRYWYGWTVAVLVVGLSRVYLGAHFPSDVLAGVLLGSASAMGAWYLRRWRQRCKGVAH